MLFRFPTVAIAAVLLSTVAFAQSPKAGDPAPSSLGGADWVVNAPENDDLKTLLGEVVFIEHWGIK
jgi:hypothetical protein